jgi:hypothetical protein
LFIDRLRDELLQLDPYRRGRFQEDIWSFPDKNVSASTLQQLFEGAILEASFPIEPHQRPVVFDRFREIISPSRSSMYARPPFVAILVKRSDNPVLNSLFVLEPYPPGFYNLDGSQMLMLAGISA